MTREYKNPLLSGKPCMIHEEFIPAMDLFCKYLSATGCRADIISALRPDTNVLGAIVTPAQMSNHLVGCAIDVNLFDKQGKRWNSKALESPKDEVLQFITLVRNSGILRWGGDFKKQDTVHFDNGLNLRNPKRWREIYNEIHNVVT